MARSDDTLERAKPTTNGLESYRRLVELQRQMIELSQLHEQTKRERDALREEVTREVIEPMLARRRLRHWLQHSTAKYLRRFRTLSLLNLDKSTVRFRSPRSVSR